MIVSKSQSGFVIKASDGEVEVLRALVEFALNSPNVETLIGGLSPAGQRSVQGCQKILARGEESISKHRAPVAFSFKRDVP